MNKELIQDLEAVYNGLNDDLDESKILLGNIIDKLETEQLRIGGVGNWVMCKDKLPLDHENYLVEGDGQYAVTFYSVRRKEWHVDFKVAKYKDIPK